MAPAIPDKISCESAGYLKQELAVCNEVLTLPETEDSWEKISRAILRLTALVKGGAYKYPQVLVVGVKAMSKPLSGAMSSERTRLSGTAIDLLLCMAFKLGSHFEPLLHAFIPTVLKLCTRTNKIYISRARALLDAITINTSLTCLIPYLEHSCHDKSTSLRAVGIDFIFHSLNRYNPPDLEKYVVNVEGAIKATGRDKDAEVRNISRKVFDSYKLLWPERVDEFTSPLTPIMRKYLDIRTRSTSTKPLGKEEPLSNSVPSSHKASHTMPRRSLSADAVEFPRSGRPEHRLQNKPEGSMGPPKIIPIRRARSQKPEARKGPEVVVAAKSNSSITSAAPSATGPSLSRTISVSSLRSVDLRTNNEEQRGARRVKQLSPTAQMARSGPSRPNLAGVSGASAPSALPSSAPANVSTFKGPSRPQSKPADGGEERRVMGARRVLVVQESQPEAAKTSPVPEVASQVKENKATTIPSESHPKSRSATPSIPTAKPSSIRPPSKAKIPSKGPVPTKPVMAVAERRRGVTAPTRAQLARAEALEKERSQSKPGSSGGRAVAKRGFAPTRGGRGRLPASGRTVARPKPESLSIPEAEIPLPLSPTLKASTGKNEVSIPLLDLVGESQQTDAAKPATLLVPQEAVEVASAGGNNDSDLISPEESLAHGIDTDIMPAEASQSAQRGTESNAEVAFLSNVEVVEKDKSPDATLKYPKGPFSTLPAFLLEAIAAPIPPTPHQSPFIRYETDADTTAPYSPRAEDDECENDDEMAKLEFAVDGFDPFGRIIESPRKKATASEQSREALTPLSFNQG